MFTPAHILVADDMLNDRLSLRLVLEAKGYSVTEAVDTNETLLKAENELPDLIILDVKMPPEDGFTICKRLRANPKTLGIPILMLTCYDRVEDKATGLYAGADDYLVKPCESPELLARITALLRRYPPKSNFIGRIEHAQRSMEVVEAYRRGIVVLNIDVKGSSVAPASTHEEYRRQLAFHDYHLTVDEVVSAHNGTKVAWAGDGGTAEFSNADTAVAAAFLILEKGSQHPRVSNLILRIGIAGGSELLEPDSEIGKRTSQTHNRAGHFQKYSNYNKVTIGKEIYISLSDKSRFQERPDIDSEKVYESK